MADRYSCRNRSWKLTRRHTDERHFFFFQAEDGIRDGTVTGVQTCALPICCRINHGGLPYLSRRRGQNNARERSLLRPSDSLVLRVIFFYWRINNACTRLLLL